MGGEKLKKPPKSWALKGSPPHGRGKGPGSAGACARHGITPAWAGKRRFILYDERPCEDHPRMGGEKAVASMA